MTIILLFMCSVFFKIVNCFDNTLDKQGRVFLKYKTQPVPRYYFNGGVIFSQPRLHLQRRNVYIAKIQPFSATRITIKTFQAKIRLFCTIHIPTHFLKFKHTKAHTVQALFYFSHKHWRLGNPCCNACVSFPFHSQRFCSF